MSVYDDVPDTPTAQQISNLYAQRRAARGPELSRMAEVQQLYDGDIVVPLPELGKQERSSLPNRTREGLKQFSQRIASAPPSLWCPPSRPGFKGAEESSRARRRAILGWWGASKLRIVMRQRARYLQGYGVSPAQVRWDPQVGVPRYEHRNPLMTFPSHLRGPEDMCPADCIFETTQPLTWLQANYPVQATVVSKPSNCKPDQLFTILEYADAQVCVLAVLGMKPDEYTTPAPGSMVVELERYPNRSGRCPVVIPRQISLSKPHGQFDGLLGMYQTEALLTAMTIIATRNGVFGEDWLISAPNMQAEIVQQPDIAEGIPGIIKDGTLQRLGTEPQFQQNITIDRLAAAQNEQAGITSELQGQAGTNIRTGARASTLLGNVIDFPIQEAQELFAESLQEENRIAVAFAKAYGDGPKSFYVDWDGERDTAGVTYDPKSTFETDENRVWYPLAGADQAGLVISGGQRVGMKTFSRGSFMRIDPLVEDPEREHDAIIGEQLEDAMLAAVSQQAASGAIPPADVARIVELVVSGKVELFEAINTAHQEAQARQATPSPQGAPEGQPGIAQPGAGAEQPPMMDANPNVAGLAAMLASLRRGQNVSPQEQMAGGPSAGAAIR